MLVVSPTAFDEIRGKLHAAGYDHALLENGLVEMTGIALQRGLVEHNGEKSEEG